MLEKVLTYFIKNKTRQKKYTGCLRLGTRNVYKSIIFLLGIKSPRTKVTWYGMLYNHDPELENAYWQSHLLHYHTN